MTASELITQHVLKTISLNAEEQDYFISLLEFKKVKRKQTLLSEGEKNRYLNFVISGCFRLFRIDKNGMEHVVQFAIKEWWISDAYSFLRGKPAKFLIDAQEDGEILRLSKENLDKLYERVPKFERFFRILAENTYLAYQQRTLNNIGHSAKERYLLFKEKYPKFVYRIPQNQIASFLGISPEFLSKIKKNLGDK